MKKISKLLIVLTCVAMVLALSVGVSALDYNKEYSVVYNVGSGTTSAIDVLVTIESNSSGLPFTVVPVHLDASSTPHMVLDALLESEISTAGFTFYNVNTPLSSSSTYFDRIKYNNVYYTGSGQGYSGWQFRINGGIPQEALNWGASIATAPIENGDVIAIYIDDPFSASTSTRFTRAHFDSAIASYVSVAVSESHQWFDPDFTWNTPAFASIGGLTVNLYSGVGVNSTPIASAVCDGDGYADFSFAPGSTLSPGTYTAKVCGNWNGTSPVSSCISTFTIPQ